MTHLILAAEAEGVATCWIQAFDPAILRRALNLTEDEVVYSIAALGYTKLSFVKKGSKLRKPLEEMVKYL
jgi:nitroreductase